MKGRLSNLRNNCIKLVELYELIVNEQVKKLSRLMTLVGSENGLTMNVEFEFIDYGNWILILNSIADMEVPSWFKWGFKGLPRHCGEQCGSNSRSAGCIKHVLYCKAQACKPGRILFLCKTPSRDTIFDRTHNCHRNSWGQVCDQDSKPWTGTSFLWIPWESPQGLNLLGQFNVYIFCIS